MDDVGLKLSDKEIADLKILYRGVFAKTDPAAGTRGITAFIVDATTPGLDATKNINVMAPHPLATLRFDACNVPASAQLGDLNGGFKLAMQTLDIFRASVAGAGCSARRWRISSSRRRRSARWPR